MPFVPEGNQCLMKRQATLAIPFLLVFTILISGGNSYAQAVKVTVSIPPQKYYAERIGGDRVSVTVLTPPSADPHTYEPKPRDLVGLAGSDLYFTIGGRFEDVWLGRLKSLNPSVRIVPTHTAVKRIPMVAGGEDDHGHGGEEEGLDPHIWLSPPDAMLVCHEMFSALVEADPDGTVVYRAGYLALAADISRLDADLAVMFAGLGDRRSFMVFHPAWGYFARAYGLDQIAVEMEGKEPKPADLARLIDTAKDKKVSAVFVQPQTSQKSAQTVADAVRGTVVVVDPLAENWLENLRKVATAFQPALR